jgi:hypothetical protein
MHVNKILSVFLQSMGILFICFIIVKISFRFYNSIDNNLQKFSWQLIQVTDTSGNKYNIEKEYQFLLYFEGRRNLKIVNDSCCEYLFKYRIDHYRNFITHSDYYQSVNDTNSIGSIPSKYSQYLKIILWDSRKYGIRNDSLWIFTAKGNFAIFKKIKKK